jgi:hypothetical protein
MVALPAPPAPEEKPDDFGVMGILSVSLGEVQKKIEAYKIAAEAKEPARHQVGTRSRVILGSREG